VQPAVPGSWVRTPVEGLREKAVMALLVWVLAYTWRPSGLTTMSAGPSKAVPSAQLPPVPVPVSLTQPAVPASWVSLPEVALEKTAMASELLAAT
jgi:hypothetical protein